MPDHLRVDQLGAEVVGKYISSGHLRVNQLGLEIIGTRGAYNKLRVDQLGAEVVGQRTSAGSMRVNQLGCEIIARTNTVPISGHIRVNQLGVEAIGKLSLGQPAGNTTGYEYYVGPGFQQGIVPKVQPSTYEPQWGNAQALVSLGSLIGTEVTAIGGSVSSVPITASPGFPLPAIPVTFPTPFVEACYCVVAIYIPQSGDPANIVVYGNTCPGGIAPTAQGFQIFGQIIAGSSSHSTGTFEYIAIGF